MKRCEAHASLLTCPGAGPRLPRGPWVILSAGLWALIGRSQSLPKCGHQTTFSRCVAARMRPMAAAAFGRVSLAGREMAWAFHGANIPRGSCCSEPQRARECCRPIYLPCLTYPCPSCTFLPHLTIAPPHRLYKDDLPTIFSRISPRTVFSSRENPSRGYVSLGRRAVSREIRLFLTAATAQPASGPKIRTRSVQKKAQSDSAA